MQLHHVAIAVSNIDETVDWYQKLFNFEEQHRYDTSGMTFCMIEKDGFRLELISYLEGQENQPEYRNDVVSDLKVNGTKHFCLEVDDVDAEYSRLEAVGAEVRTGIKEAGFGGRYFFVKDNNGILFEIWSAK